MGYRLDVIGKKTKINFYGTKLYGYESNEVLSSYEYLVKIGKFNGDELFSYSCENEITLNKDEFKEFIKLYNDDYNKLRECTPDIFLMDSEIQQLATSDEDKIISWC